MLSIEIMPGALIPPSLPPSLLPSPFHPQKGSSFRRRISSCTLDFYPQRPWLTRLWARGRRRYGEWEGGREGGREGGEAGRRRGGDRWRRWAGRRRRKRRWRAGEGAALCVDCRWLALTVKGGRGGDVDNDMVETEKGGRSTREVCLPCKLDTKQRLLSCTGTSSGRGGLSLLWLGRVWWVY